MAVSIVAHTFIPTAGARGHLCGYSSDILSALDSLQKTVSLKEQLPVEKVMSKEGPVKVAGLLRPAGGRGGNSNEPTVDREEVARKRGVGAHPDRPQPRLPKSNSASVQNWDSKVVYRFSSCPVRVDTSDCSSAVLGRTLDRPLAASLTLPRMF